MKTTILSIRRNGPYQYLTIQAPTIARKAKPGQFVEIRIGDGAQTFWRRPFSICNATGEALQLLIKSVGKGSAWISRAKIGDSLEITGPFGNTFQLPGKNPVWLVGGGFGVAPLYFLASRLSQTGRSMAAFIGARTAKDLLLCRDMRQLGVRIFCATNDGSTGTKGLVTDVLKQQLAKPGVRPLLAAAGPHGMLKAVAGTAAEFGVKAQVSLEEVMACGMGVCNGCVVKVDGVYKRVCKDGTIFPAELVAWDK